MVLLMPLPPHHLCLIKIQNGYLLLQHAIFVAIRI